MEKYHFQTGEHLPFLDTFVNLHVYREDRKTVKIVLAKSKKEADLQLLLFVPYEAGYEEKRSAIEKWYRSEAKAIFNQVALQYAAKLGVSFEEIRVKDQKSRWGSCSSKKNMNFNWRLVMAPKEVLCYVVVHELCHLRHLDHSKAFWSLVESIYPDYRDCKKWLKERGGELYRI